MAKAKKKAARKPMAKAGGRPGGSAPSGAEYSTSGFGGGKVTDRGRRTRNKPWPAPTTGSVG